VCWLFNKLIGGVKFQVGFATKFGGRGRSITMRLTKVRRQLYNWSSNVSASEPIDIALAYVSDFFTPETSLYKFMQSKSRTALKTNPL
jgi:hypothetical protein